MKKEELVKIFFGKDRLLSPEALDYIYTFSEKELSDVLKRESGDVIILKHHLSDVKRYEIVKNLHSKNRTDALSYLNCKFDKIKSIIMNRIDKRYTSVNKIIPNREDVYLVGMVKDIKEGDKTLVELEDQTGSTIISFDSSVKCDLDDVVAVQAIAAGKTIYGKKIIYPDVPLREPAKGNGKACFISDLHLNEVPFSDAQKFFQWFNQESIGYLFVAGDVVDIGAFEEFCENKLVFLIPGECDVKDDYPQLPLKTKKDNIISLSNPSIVNIGGLNILSIHEFDISMLKKRHLGEAPLVDDYLALDIVPDIVHYGHDHKPFVSNYKAITLVNSGSMLTEFRPVVVDFSSREWKQIAL